MSISVPSVSADIEDISLGATDSARFGETKTASISDYTFRASDISSVPASEENVFANALSVAYDRIAEIKESKSIIEPKSLVDEIKSDMVPDFQAGDKLEKNGNFDEVIGVVTKSFNHATFVAMVTQVASGVSSSVKLLVRQS